MTTASKGSSRQVKSERTSWFTTKEWGVLVAAIAVVAVGITAAAMTPDDSLAAAAASAPTPSHCSKPANAETTATAAETTPEASAETTESPSAETSGVKTAAVTTASTATTRIKTHKKVKKTPAKAASPSPKATESALVSAGLTVELGSYKGAPLQWLVLDANDDELLLLSEDVLSAGAFQSDWESADASRYASSEVRSWLVNTFALQAFSEQQRDALLPHSGGAADGDRAFLLTVAEARRYLPKATQREASAHDGDVGYSGEALALKDNHPQWWLADSATGDARAQMVRADGSLSNELVYYADLGVRPAIRVDRSKIALTLTSQGGN